MPIRITRATASLGRLCASEGPRRASGPLSVVLALATAAGCSGAGSAPELVGDARVGLDPVPRIHRYENHSSALIAWREAGVRNRVVVHLDGHADFDWLPDETIARIATTPTHELHALELHPYSLDGDTYRKFGIWNFLYPAARLGIMRELVWVVPDGTLKDPVAVARFVRTAILNKMQMVSLDEAKGLSRDGRVLRGRLLGVPVLICEIRDLPSFDEPVLLDIDLDFLTTRSATTQEVTFEPWIGPDELVQRLAERGLRTDLVTVSLSTIGGYLPPWCRWVGGSMVRALERPGGGRNGDHDNMRRLLHELSRGRFSREAAETAQALTQQSPEDPTVWFLLGWVLHGLGSEDPARRAHRRAVALDPLLEHAELFDADRLWLNHRYEEALSHYEVYLRGSPRSPYRAYALRRKAGCLQHLGRKQEAVKVFREVVRLAPEHADSHLDLGLLLRDLGRVNEALEHFQRARSILPERAEYALALGTTYVLLGRLQEGLVQIQQAVARRPCWAVARAHLALALKEAGADRDAAQELEVALFLDPNQPHLRRLARELHRQGLQVPVGSTTRRP